MCAKSTPVQSPVLNLDPDVTSALLTSFNNDEKRLLNLLSVLSIPPKYSTLRINLQTIEVKCAVERLQHYFEEQCSSTATEYYNMYLHPVLPDCVVFENRGPYHVTELSKSIVVDNACGMAVLRGANVYMQGILGAPKDLKSDDWVSVYADLEGKCLKGFAGQYTGHCHFVGNGVSVVSRGYLFNADGPHSGLAILMAQPLFEAPSLSDLPFDWTFPQNLPSIACVHILAPQPGEHVLDMCAAPGGKASHIAALVGNSGRVTALEKSPKRMKKMEQMFHQIGINNIDCFVFDATKACASPLGCDKNPPFPPDSFHRILVDAPCSALGQRPSHVNRISLSQLKSFPVIQQKLLIAAARLLRLGGVMVYSTCTICREENEDQVTKLLKSCPELALVDTPYTIGGPGLHCSDLSQEQLAQVQRFDPSDHLSSQPSSSSESHDSDTIGFFVTKFQKKQEMAV